MNLTILSEERFKAPENTEFELIADMTGQILIFGILTPLMTQVVVDKVLSHHAMSTLYTISIGIFIVYIYELIIGLAKNYLFFYNVSLAVIVVASIPLFALLSLIVTPLFRKEYDFQTAAETIYSPKR